MVRCLHVRAYVAAVAGGVYSHVRLEVILSHILVRGIKIEIVPEQNKIF